MTVTLLLGVRAIYYRALVDNRVRMWKRHGDIYIYIYMLVEEVRTCRTVTKHTV